MSHRERQCKQNTHIIIIIIIINTNHAITSVNIVCSFLLSPLSQSLINCFPCYNIFNGWKLGKAIAKKNKTYIKDSNNHEEEEEVELILHFCIEKKKKKKR